MLRALPSLAEQGAFPTLVQGRGFLAGYIPTPLGATLFLHPSHFPDRGHCSQHCLMGAAAPNPPALPYSGLRLLVLTIAQAEPRA